MRRKAATPLADPRGKTLRLASLPPAELVRFLGDTRPEVRDQAVELLVQAGEPAVSALAAAHSAAAVFALGRIGRGTAPAAVRDGLRDADFELRIAAARMTGMARDRDAVTRPMEMVQKDEPAVRRQAATALGQIGDPQAVPALLRAAANPVDRFLEHAIIYSLILLRTPEPVAEALKSGNPATRKAALIALDQIDGSPLRRVQITYALRDTDAELRRAALWVVARHPDWSGEVIQLIQARLMRGGFLPGEEEAVQGTPVAFCGDAEAQSMIGRLLGDRAASTRQQLFLLDTIGQCATPQLPASWKAALRQRLLVSDDAVRARVLALARTRQLSELDDDL